MSNCPSLIILFNLDNNPKTFFFKFTLPSNTFLIIILLLIFTESISERSVSVINVISYSSSLANSLAIIDVADAIPLI